MKISTYGSVNFVSGMSLDRPTRPVRLGLRRTEAHRSSHAAN